jgi:hypothetical protein
MQQQEPCNHPQKVRLEHYLNHQYEEPHYLPPHQKRHLRESLNNFQNEHRQKK